MITYHYISSISPAAPFAVADLSSLDGQTVVAGLNAQVDSAADRTVVPASVISRLGATAIEERQFGGFDGAVSKLPVFRILLTIHGMTSPFLVDVIGSAHEPWVLLGRDILNQIRVLLDGPRQRMEIN